MKKPSDSSKKSFPIYMKQHSLSRREQEGDNLGVLIIENKSIQLLTQTSKSRISCEKKVFFITTEMAFEAKKSEGVMVTTMDDFTWSVIEGYSWKPADADETENRFTKKNKIVSLLKRKKDKKKIESK